MSKVVKIYCDHCGEDVFPEKEEETYFSIKYFKCAFKQEFHLCECCRKELKKFLNGTVVTDVKDMIKYQKN